MNIDTIRERAAQYDRNHVVRGYYFEPDHGDVVCWDCLQKLVSSGLVVDRDEESELPAWWPEDPSANHDTLPRCEAPAFRLDGKEVGCGKILEGFFTDYGAEDELSHFEEYGIDFDDEECYIWDLLDMAFIDGSEEKERLYALASKAEVKA